MLQLDKYFINTLHVWNKAIRVPVADVTIEYDKLKKDVSISSLRTPLVERNSSSLLLLPLLLLLAVQATDIVSIFTLSPIATSA